MLAKRSDIREAMAAEFFKVEVMAESKYDGFARTSRLKSRPSPTDDTSQPNFNRPRR